MKIRLEKTYGLKNIKVIPNAISKIPTKKTSKIYKLPINRTLFFYPCVYHIHKNLEILIPLSKKIKKLNLPYNIITTIDPNDGYLAKKFLGDIKLNNIDDIIINIGRIPNSDIGEIYKKTDALLMPTLLESYGLPYVEAINYRKLILTTRFDLAYDVCGDIAYYFDPLDADSILDAIKIFINDIKLKKEKLKKMKLIINKFHTPKKMIEKYHDVMGVNHYISKRIR